jgi:hypothetical protein
MDLNQFSTGNLKLDIVLLGISWTGAFATLSAVPIILSSIASIMVIINQVYQYQNRKKKK